MADNPPPNQLQKAAKNREELLLQAAESGWGVTFRLLLLHTALPAGRFISFATVLAIAHVFNIPLI